MSARGPVAAGLVLIVLGSLFLVRALVPEMDLGRLWPVASVVLGAALVLLSIRPGRSTD